MSLLFRLLFVSFFFFPLAVLAQPTKVGAVEGVTEYRLDNGLKVLLIPDPGQPSITLNITYLVGARHERYGETGMAHLLEHLLFKGAPQHPDIPQELTRRGMRPNGATTADYTSYYETFAAREDYLDWALGMEADRMVNSFIAEKDLRSEMTVVRNEMERGENSVSAMLRQKTLAAAYQWHNYGHSVIGARSDVENVHIGSLQAFYRLYYQPDNAILALAGQFQPERALQLIERHFGAIAKPARQLPPLYTVEPPQEGERYVRLERIGEKRLFNVVYHLPAAAHPDTAALDILLTVMADTPSGRLYRALVKRGMATAVGGWNDDLFDPAYAFYRVQLSKDAAPLPVSDRLLATLEGAGQHPVTADEVATARRILQTQFEKTCNDPARLARALVNAASLGDWRLFFWQRDQLAKVSVADVNRVARHYYRPANRTLGEFVPVSRSSRVEIPAAPDVQQQLKGYVGGASPLAGEAFDPSPAGIEARIRKSVLPNGMQLALLPRQTRGNVVQAVLRLNFGNAENLRGRAEVAAYASAMLMRGTRQHDREALAREFDRLHSRVGVSGSGQGVTVSIETIRENLPETLRLVREVLREPAFPSGEFEQLRQQARAGLEAARMEPDGKVADALARHFNNYPPDDIRYSPTYAERLQALDSLSLAELRDFHSAFYGADHAQFAAVGAFDAEATRRLLAELFGDWHSPASWQRVSRPFRVVGPILLRLETPDKQNAVFSAALRIPVGESHPDYPALLLASRILGGGFISSRLANRLRQREGLSYSVGAEFSARRDENSALFSAYAIYAPQFRARVEKAFREELMRISRDGFSAEELKDAQNALLQEGSLARSRGNVLAQMLLANLYYGQDFSRVVRLEARLQELGPDEVLAAWRRHVDPMAFSLFFAGDFSAPGKGREQAEKL